MRRKLKTILVSLVIAVAMIVVQHAQAISIFESTRGLDTPLAKDN